MSALDALSVIGATAGAASCIGGLWWLGRVQRRRDTEQAGVQAVTALTAPVFGPPPVDFLPPSTVADGERPANDTAHLYVDPGTGRTASQVAPWATAPTAVRPPVQTAGPDGPTMVLAGRPVQVEFAEPAVDAVTSGPVDAGTPRGSTDLSGEDWATLPADDAMPALLAPDYWREMPANPDEATPLCGQVPAAPALAEMTFTQIRDRESWLRQMREEELRQARGATPQGATRVNGSHR